MNRHVLLTIVLAAVVALGVSSWFLFGAASSTAPDFSLTDIDGRSFKLSDFRGKVVILDFMSVWCDPCWEQTPHLKMIKDTYGDEVEVVSIEVNPAEPEEHVLRFKAVSGATYIFALDVDGAAVKYNVVFYPTVVVIDRQGVVRFRNEGLTPYSELRVVVEELLR